VCELRKKDGKEGRLKAEQVGCYIAEAHGIIWLDRKAAGGGANYMALPSTH
jgi:hypothetical protein